MIKYKGFIKFSNLIHLDMSENFGNKLSPEGFRNNYNKFAHIYTKEAVLGRIKLIQDTPMGVIIDQALNLVGLDFTNLENLDYTEEQAKKIASFMSDIYLQLDTNNVEEAKATAEKLAEYINLP